MADANFKVPVICRCYALPSGIKYPPRCLNLLYRSTEVLPKNIYGYLVTLLMGSADSVRRYS